MDECSACHVDYSHNPDVRVFFAAACDHRVCEPCITRLFRHGRAYPCPACGQSVRAEDFSEQSREAKQIESEVTLRHQICDIFCKTAEDFATEEQYNEYLVQREDTIYGLVNPSSQEQVQETWRYIDQYREQNAEQIFRVQSLQQRRKFQKILSIIEEEGVFCSRVNAEWGEHLGPGAASHPFQIEFRGLLSNPPADARDASRDNVETSPFAPQPLLGEYGTADKARQMSGGGQSPDTYRKKARHFFFSDLVAAASAVEQVA